MTLPLSRPYVSRYGAPVLDRVDPRIFTLTYFAECMDCTFCDDACCQHGADIEVPRIAALDQYRAEFEQYTGVPRDEWYRDDPEDIGILPEAEYPGGAYTRTNFQELPKGRSRHTEWACVFQDPVGRGCRIHSFALQKGIDVHEIKPMVCLLFPLSFDQGELEPAYEFDVDDLVCIGPGPNLYRAARSDVLYYFGAELVAELDALERTQASTNGNIVPLPQV
jgi:Fe-S-cluster containining protein